MILLCYIRTTQEQQHTPIATIGHASTSTVVVSFPPAVHSFAMTDAMEVEESCRQRPSHHQDSGGGTGSGGSDGDRGGGGRGGSSVHANKEAGFQADVVVVSLVAADARRSTGEEESQCQGREAHAVATSPSAEEDDGCCSSSNLIEAGNFAPTAAAAATAAGEKSPPPQAPALSRLLLRRRLLPTTTTTTKQNILSRGDLPHAKTHGNMTINQHQAVAEKSDNSSEAVEAMAIDRRESDDDVPMNLVSGQREEAVNLTKCTNLVGLSAKMRLKKQRLEAITRTASELNPSSPRVATFSDHSALHRLAEAAERKQVCTIVNRDLSLFLA